MDILTEADLRSRFAAESKRDIVVKKGTFVTPLAMEYIKTNGLKLIVEDGVSSSGTFGKGLMSYTPIKQTGNDRFVDYKSGKTYSHKPEHMTHLRDNLLVEKNHPRILFRGKLDSLEALIIKTQITAAENGRGDVAEQLDDVMEFVKLLLGCEVKDEPVPEFKLLGMDSQRLRYVSHHIYEEFGIQHSVPHYSMGRVCAELNYLRTFIRETELSAVEAFTVDGEMKRSDIVEALNRLSSCVYIIFCKVASGNKKG